MLIIFLFLYCLLFSRGGLPQIMKLRRLFPTLLLFSYTYFKEQAENGREFLTTLVEIDFKYSYFDRG